MVITRRADPLHFTRIEGDAVRADELAENLVAVERADRQTIRLGHSVDVIRGDQAPRAGHVFYDDGRITRDIFPHVSGDGSSVGIESAPGGKADHDSNHLAAIEFVARRGRWCGQRRANSDNDSENRKQSFVHGSNFLLVGWRLKDTIRKGRPSSIAPNGPSYR